MSESVDNYLDAMGLEVGDELKHYGKKGMKWGVRNDDKPSGKPKSSGDGPNVGTQKSQNEAYKKNPTVREYLAGTGKTFDERAASRATAGKLAVAAILGGAAAKVAVNTIPQLKQYKAGVSEAATIFQLAGAGVAIYADAAGRVDYITSKPKS